MITKITTVEELKQIFTEILFNRTDKVNKISEHSVLNGISYGCAKVGQKAMKDIAIVESHLFPETAEGEALDITAKRYGVSQRFGSSGSSVWIRIAANTGTEYLRNVHFFRSSTGKEFQLEEDVIIGESGFAYAKTRSQDIGSQTNIPALSINVVNPTPEGHKSVVNEVQAIGGRDVEDDNLFRKRIVEGVNILSRGTLSYLTQAFLKVNENILRVFNYGKTQEGKLRLAIVTQNGIDLNQSELNELLEKSRHYFSLTDLLTYAQNYSTIELVNVKWFPIDISFRVKINESYNPDEVRTEIQSKLISLFDFRTWNADKIILWSDLFFVCKNTKGVEYLPDQYFFPPYDLKVPKNRLPRLRGFLMLNLDGKIISDFQGNLSPIYYPNYPDFSFQQTVLKDL